MPINDWPPAERPREKLLAKGPRSLSDAEIIAIFLRNGVRGKTAVDLAREMITGFGGLRALIDATHSEFCRTHGGGTAKYVQIQAALELGRRYLEEKLTRGDALCNPEDTHRYLNASMRNLPHEVFACLFLDTRHRIICFEELFRGTLDAASVYPREVVKRALLHNAAAVILAHNHPSGIAEPSSADKALTERLRSALELIDIRVLDHFVIGEGDIVSMAERGLM
ncbi:MAG: DNA repair protein RadC [Pseudomonadota bacterium]|nr:DNA repair protein RadC [Pseudomonadota bacterium]